MKLFVLGLYLTKFRAKNFLYFIRKEAKMEIDFNSSCVASYCSMFPYLCDTKAEIFLSPRQKEGQIGGS